MEWNEEDGRVRSREGKWREIYIVVNRSLELPSVTFDVAKMKEIAASEQDTAGCAEQTKLSHQRNLACTFPEPETFGLTPIFLSNGCTACITSPTSWKYQLLLGDMRQLL